jgi:hypothetical protein
MPRNMKRKLQCAISSFICRSLLPDLLLGQMTLVSRWSQHCVVLPGYESTCLSTFGLTLFWPFFHKILFTWRFNIPARIPWGSPVNLLGRGYLLFVRGSLKILLPAKNAYEVICTTVIYRGSYIRQRSVVSDIVVRVEGRFVGV